MSVFVTQKYFLLTSVMNIHSLFLVDGDSGKEKSLHSRFNFGNPAKNIFSLMSITETFQLVETRSFSPLVIQTDLFFTSKYYLLKLLQKKNYEAGMDSNIKLLKTCFFFPLPSLPRFICLLLHLNLI